MATEGNGGLGSSEEVREGQLMDLALERVAAVPMDDSTHNTIQWLESFIRGLVREAFEHFVQSGPASVAAFLIEDMSTQNTIPWLESYIRRHVREAFEHFVQSGPASVAAFLIEDMSTQNTIPWLESFIRGLVREAFEHFVQSGLASVAAFLIEDMSTQNAIPWLESYIRRHVCEAFEHVVMSGPAVVDGREQIQEPDGRIWQLRLQTRMPDHFFVGKKVEGRGGTPIRVKLIDATTGHVVESGDLSSLTLDVVVLAGDFNNEDDDDWTWEHFKSKEEPSREGKGPLLEGDLQVSLEGGVGLLEDIKFTDISTCRPSGKFRLGVKVESGFFKGIRVREAKTDAFEVKHYKRESEEKNVPRALDDDVCTLKSIGKNGPSHRNLNAFQIFKVEHFLWKLFLDPEGLRKILGKTVSNKNWKSLRDHAKESVPSGKYHVYYADKMKNSGVVFKNMSELCGLIEDGVYHSTKTLSDSRKEYENTLKKRAGDNWKDIVEYVGPLPLEMNPSKRARSSQTDVVTWAPESCLSDIDLASSSFVRPPENPPLDIEAPVPCQTPLVPSGEADENSMPDSEDPISRYLQDEDPIDLTSLLQQDLSVKADGNTSLDAFCREVDLPESSLDPSEQANGTKEVSVEAENGYSFEPRTPSYHTIGSPSISNSVTQHIIHQGGHRVQGGDRVGNGNVNVNVQRENRTLGGRVQGRDWVGNGNFNLQPENRTHGGRVQSRDRVGNGNFNLQPHGGCVQSRDRVGNGNVNGNIQRENRTFGGRVQGRNRVGNGTVNLQPQNSTHGGRGYRVEAVASLESKFRGLSVARPVV